MFERQAEAQSTKLLRASIYCSRGEHLFKSLSITISAAVCILGVFNQYFDFFGNALWLAFITGLAFMVDAVMFMFARYSQKWSASLMDVYDHHVYGIPSNKLMTKFMSMASVDVLSRRVRMKKKYKKHYFATKEDADRHCAIFTNQYKQFMNEYNLLHFARTTLYVMWVSVIVALITVAAVLNDQFLNTVTNIFVPSLPILLLIMNAWITYEENLRDMRRYINSLEKKRQEFASDPNAQNLNSPMFLRTVQDSVFQFRSQNFTVPFFLHYMFAVSDRRRKKELEKQGLGLEESIRIRKRRKKKPDPKTASPLKQSTPSKPTTPHKVTPPAKSTSTPKTPAKSTPVKKPTTPQKPTTKTPPQKKK